MKLKYFHKSHLISWLFSVIRNKPRDEKELLKELRFTIGEQYENYEFGLKSYGSETINGLTYEVYLYDKDDFKTLFGIPIDKGIWLYFNADVLSCVEYRFDGNHFDYLLNEINNSLGSKIIQNISEELFIRLKNNTILGIIITNP